MKVYKRDQWEGSLPLKCFHLGNLNATGCMPEVLPCLEVS